MLGTRRPADRLGFLDRRAAPKSVVEISRRYGLEVRPDALVRDLPVGVQQRVEIVKALSRAGRRLLILDEPTAVLTPLETEDLFRSCAQLRTRARRSCSSRHKLQGSARHRRPDHGAARGARGRHSRPQEATEAELAAMMVGRKVELAGAPRLMPSLAGRCYDVQGSDACSISGGSGSCDGVSFVGAGGRDPGRGRRAGQRPDRVGRGADGPAQGGGGRRAHVGQEMTHALVRRRIEAGLSHVPEDRQKHGLVLAYPVADNLVLCTYYQRALRPRRQPRSGCDRGECAAIGAGLRHPHAGRVGHRRLPLRRQPAEDDRGSASTRARYGF